MHNFTLLTICLQFVVKLFETYDGRKALQACEGAETIFTRMRYLLNEVATCLPDEQKQEVIRSCGSVLCAATSSVREETWFK